MNIEKHAELALKTALQYGAVNVPIYTGQTTTIVQKPCVRIIAGDKQEIVPGSCSYWLTLNITVESSADSSGVTGGAATRLSAHQNLVNQIERICLLPNIHEIMTLRQDSFTCSAWQEVQSDAPEIEDRAHVYTISIRIVCFARDE